MDGFQDFTYSPPSFYWSGLTRSRLGLAPFTTLSDASPPTTLAPTALARFPRPDRGEPILERYDRDDPIVLAVPILILGMKPREAAAAGAGDGERA